MLDRRFMMGVGGEAAFKEAMAFWTLLSQIWFSSAALGTAGLFLGVLAKTQFVQNAKTQFENTKTQFENAKTQFEN